MALVRMLQDVDETFDDYKRIIKTMLFAGATRSIKSNSNMTPLEMLNENREQLSEKQYKSLQIILGTNRECMCL